MKALIVAAIAAATAIVLSLSEPVQLLRAWLVGWIFWAGISGGSLALVLVHDVTGGRWGKAIRGELLSAAAVLPLMALLAIPLIAGAPLLYERVSIAGFAITTIAVLAILLALLHLVRKRRVEGMGRLSAIALIVYVLTMTVASWQWLMNADPRWWSTAFGSAVLASQALTALAAAIVVSRGAGSAHTNVDLGNLLFALTLFWMYIAFAQFLIVWMANLPHEVAWYEPRIERWGSFAVAVVVFSFAVPLMLLLLQFVKAHAILLGPVAALILVAQLAWILWLVAPAFHPERIVVRPADVLLPLAIGAAWVSFRGRQVAREQSAPR